MTDELRADCSRCTGLCCVAPAFTRSSDFAVSKPAGKPCVNLGADFRCGIHDQLRPSGFPGCVVYDCFGAGQKVTQITFGGVGWHQAPDGGAAMFSAFEVMRDLHELLYFLTQAASLRSTAPLRAELARATDRVRAMTARPAADLIAIDTAELRSQINPLLTRVSDLARAHLPGAADHRGASLIGASMRGADLRGASLRGALLIGADLRNADLAYADLTGADLRGADLHGATLATALFLTQSQLEAAKGDTRTMIPPSAQRPAHWNGA